MVVNNINYLFNNSLNILINLFYKVKKVFNAYF